MSESEFSKSSVPPYFTLCGLKIKCKVEYCKLPQNVYLALNSHELTTTICS